MTQHEKDEKCSLNVDKQDITAETLAYEDITQRIHAMFTQGTIPSWHYSDEILAVLEGTIQESIIIYGENKFKIIETVFDNLQKSTINDMNKLYAIIDSEFPSPKIHNEYPDDDLNGKIKKLLEEIKIIKFYNDSVYNETILNLFSSYEGSHAKVFKDRQERAEGVLQRIILELCPNIDNNSMINESTHTQLQFKFIDLSKYKLIKDAQENLNELSYEDGDFIEDSVYMARNIGILSFLLMLTRDTSQSNFNMKTVDLLKFLSSIYGVYTRGNKNDVYEREAEKVKDKIDNENILSEEIETTIKDHCLEYNGNVKKHNKNLSSLEEQLKKQKKVIAETQDSINKNSNASRDYFYLEQENEIYKKILIKKEKIEKGLEKNHYITNEKLKNVYEKKYGIISKKINTKKLIYPPS